MIRATALALAITMSFAGAALADPNLPGKYAYTGTETDGTKYDDGGTLVISAEPSGAYLVKWDGGEFLGVGQLVDKTLAVAAVADNKNTIMLMSIGADGKISGRWWRRSDAGTKGTEVWTKQ
jgi:hypothetical protein